MRKPDSLSEASIHCKLIWVDETTRATRRPGSAGGCSGDANVVALASLEGSEAPTALCAVTR